MHALNDDCAIHKKKEAEQGRNGCVFTFTPAIITVTVKIVKSAHLSLTKNEAKKIHVKVYIFIHLNGVL